MYKLASLTSHSLIAPTDRLVTCSNGPALELAGPAGLLVAFFIVSFITIMVMEGVSELTQLFPAPNAVFEYVRAFVDEDLAWVVGIAYW